MRLFIFLFALCIISSVSAFNWEPTDAYAIKFSTAKAEGTFTDLKGTIDFDADDLANANFDVSVAAASINTGNNTKDKHAIGESWLDAEHFPRISFQSHTFRESGDGYIVDGQLTIHGKKRPVSIPFSFDDNVFHGELSINRRDFGIEGPFLFGGLVGDDVMVSLQIPVK
ncbi:YceI family protein [Neolewinella aurantiaca]|uniref:YceI family protein n=1 Tax=Neolewinella aurantiaca TaxID=2602767 RepID=A0A5C7FL97_9BACT|nr:YceI family protein [Neolewinella aurantiaca]TXF90813.1 YceI family protein [Neolewinella aurantiaca]